MPKDVGDAFAASGATFLRYGGTFTETAFASSAAGSSWRLYDGPKWLRPPYTADHGVVKDTKLRRWSRGFEPFEVLDLCHVAGSSCAVALPHWETPESLAGRRKGAERSHTFERLSLYLSSESLQVSPYSQEGVHLRAPVYRVLRIPPRGAHLSSRSRTMPCVF